MKVEQIENIAMIGAGTMGSGMSLCVAAAGYNVHLFDISSQQLDKALQRIGSCQNVLIQEGVLEEADAQAARGRIRCFNDLSLAVAEAQFIIEAVPEVLELKRRVFAQIDQACPEDAIRVTNTSGLSVTEITRGCRWPQGTAGMHWVNPPELVPLVEIIRGEQSSDETIQLVYDLAEKLGKMPVFIQKETPGIGLNRLQFAMLREAAAMVESGAVSPQDVDRIMRYGLGFRYPWIGPLQTADLGGLDVFYEISKYLFSSLSDTKKPSVILQDLVEQGHLGVKSGQGFYNYGAGTAAKILRRRDRAFVRQWRLIQEVDSQDDCED